MEEQDQSRRQFYILIGAAAVVVVIFFSMYAEMRRLIGENRRLDGLVTQLRADLRHEPAPVPVAPVADSTREPVARVSMPGEESGVTMTNFSRLKTGLTYQQVVAILGKEGTELSSNEIAGIKTVMYQWEGESFGANMNAMFQRGKLIQKAQFGLK